jgi:hypothetical protein
MPPTIRQVSATERREIYRTHVLPRLAAGELRVTVEEMTHPAPGLWTFTASELVVVRENQTGVQLAIGHRHSREGKVFTRDGLDPKWVLHDNVIYAQ